VGCDLQKQRGGIVPVERVAPTQNFNKHVAHGIEGLSVMAKETPTTTQHHCTVRPVQLLDVDRHPAPSYGTNTAETKKCHRDPNQRSRQAVTQRRS
jgi:hypothetical protein